QAARVGGELEARLRAADSSAHDAGLAEEHRAQLPTSTAALAGDTLAPREAAIRRTLERRERAIGVLRDLERALAQTQSAFEAAEAARTRAEADASAARETEHNARDALAAAAAGLLAGYSAWQ